MSQPMQTPFLSVFKTANFRQRKAAYSKWHRHQSKCYILRTQMGFEQVSDSRPESCRGCHNYHGKMYGSTLATRTRLICGFHPYGWLDTSPCPNWFDNQQVND